MVSAPFQNAEPQSVENQVSTTPSQVPDREQVAISVIIPALNEENYLPGTLQSIQAASRYLEDHAACSTEVIVVDNGSTDRTADVARAHGATVLNSEARNISKARNTGAASAHGELLVFIDADVTVPEKLFWRLTQITAAPSVIGGAVHPDYQPKRALVRRYIHIRQAVSRRMKIAQGCTQFCRRGVFEAIGGYDEERFMGEDVRFYRLMRAFARKRGMQVAYVDDICVCPSSRRQDSWPLWRIALYSSPWLCLLLGRRRGAWPGWYRNPPR